LKVFRRPMARATPTSHLSRREIEDKRSLRFADMAE
jgi:hypothetical protein